jgi:hypothetical protein
MWCAFDRRFRASLSEHKYTRWAADLDNATLHAVLSLVGEFSMRVARVTVAHARFHTVQVPAFAMNTRRVAAALGMLAEIGRGQRMDRNAAGERIRDILQWDEDAAHGYAEDLQLVRRLPETEELPPDQRWTITSRRSSFTCELSHGCLLIAFVDCKTGEVLPAQPVGCFALDLERLVNRGFASRKGQDSMEVHLLRDLDGCVCIVGKGGRLVLGRPAEDVAAAVPAATLSQST